MQLLELFTGVHPQRPKAIVDGAVEGVKLLLTSSACSFQLCIRASQLGAVLHDASIHARSGFLNLDHMLSERAAQFRYARSVSTFELCCRLLKHHASTLMTTLVVGAKILQLPSYLLRGLGLQACELSQVLPGSVPHSSDRILQIFAHIPALAGKVEPHPIYAIVKVVDRPAQRFDASV